MRVSDTEQKKKREGGEREKEGGLTSLVKNKII